MKITAAKEKKVHEGIVDLVRMYERSSDATAEERRLHNVRDEVARRIIENYKLAETRERAFREVLIVLADYTTHSWAYLAFSSEKQRIGFADYVMELF